MLHHWGWDTLSSLEIHRECVLPCRCDTVMPISQTENLSSEDLRDMAAISAFPPVARPSLSDSLSLLSFLSPLSPASTLCVSLVKVRTEGNHLWMWPRNHHRVLHCLFLCSGSELCKTQGLMSVAVNFRCEFPWTSLLLRLFSVSRSVTGSTRWQPQNDRN